MAMIWKDDQEKRLRTLGWFYQAEWDRWVYPNGDGTVRYGKIVDGVFTNDVPLKPDEPIAVSKEVEEQMPKHDPLFAWMEKNARDMQDEAETQYRINLRDKFAMHFLGGVVAKHGLLSIDAPNVALRAYEFADAMMIAREMKHGTEPK